MTESLVDRVARAIARDALIPADARTLALVSGGPDSMCLLDVLARLVPRRIGVLTFDHGLRADAPGECDLVAAAAAARGVPVWREFLDLRDGPGLQARARSARRAAADAVARREGFDLVATGHTATDNVETILFRLARGTGRTGALGIRPSTERFVRPLLGIERSEARAWCVDNDVPFVDDPSNRDDRFARTRVRDRLVPAFTDVHPGAQTAIARFAAQLADEADVLAPIVDAAWNRCRRDDGLDVRSLLAEDRACARLVVRRWLHDAGIGHEERWVAATLDISARGRGMFDAPGGRIGVSRGIVEVIVPGASHPAAVLSVPGSVGFGDRRIVASRGPARAPERSAISIHCGSALVVRAPRPGDRIPLGDAGHARVGRLLRECGVPAHLRPQVPVVVADGRVVWVAGYRANPQMLAEPGDNAIRLEMV